jgi:hypothetical protein
MRNKKVWGSIIAVVVLLAAAYFYLNYRNRTLSPPGSATLTSGGVTVTINYSRPSVKGRVIFGTKEQGALQPYGQYWRLGANESTEITINRDVQFNGSPIKAGTYRMYAIPGPDSFEIALNSELGKWGAFEPDTKLDVLRTKVPVEKISSPVEQYTISLAPEGEGINVIFEWSDTRFVVPIKAQ